MLEAFQFHLFFALGFIICCYVAVIIACLGDLYSGIRKAKQRGERIRSHKLRDTVDKAAKYYNILLIFSLLDFLQMGFVIFADHLYHYNIVLFPIITLLGTIGVIFIELKSIFEKADEKTRKDYKDLGIVIAKMAREHSKEQVASEIIKYLGIKDEKDE